jgi:hypothetical protein
MAEVHLDAGGDAWESAKTSANEVNGYRILQIQREFGFSSIQDGLKRSLISDCVK